MSDSSAVPNLLFSTSVPNGEIIINRFLQGRYYGTMIETSTEDIIVAETCFVDVQLKRI